jgi:hypothetical protein
MRHMCFATVVLVVDNSSSSVGLAEGVRNTALTGRDSFDRIIKPRTILSSRKE